MTRQACKVLKSDPLESLPQKFKCLFVLQNDIISFGFIPVGGAQESEIQKHEAGTDTSSVFHHAILSVPVLQPRDAGDGPHWFYWSGKFIQQNMCPCAIQQAADPKEIQRIPKTCHQNNELCCIAWDTGLSFSLQNISTGSSKHPVRLMQSFHTALQVTTQVRCQCWALYWLVKYELSKYFVKIVYYKKMWKYL